MRAPAALVVQGGTTTVLAGTLAAFWRGIPVVHLEAGLRTNDLSAPFPEKGGLRMVSRLAALHLAPTDAAVAALRGEGVAPGRIVLTGNTVVDAVEHIPARAWPAKNRALAEMELRLHEQGRRLVLVTSHRRESWGSPCSRCCPLWPNWCRGTPTSRSCSRRTKTPRCGVTSGRSSAGCPA